jgi:hypothetical protein
MRADILDQLLGEEIELWHSPERTAYATVAKGGHRENYPVMSRDFAAWLIWRAIEAGSPAPSGQAIDDARRMAEAIALNRGPATKPGFAPASTMGRSTSTLVMPTGPPSRCHRSAGASPMKCRSNFSDRAGWQRCRSRKPAS